MLLVGRDEHDLRADGEAPEHPGKIQAIQAGHPDITEHDVEPFGVESPQGFGSATRRADPAHPPIRVK